jgi:hypothetical protein
MKTDLQPQPITNLGTPFNNPQKVDFNYVGSGTTYAGGFGSNQNPASFGITPAFASNNVSSAAASALKGGGKRKNANKSKNYNVTVKAFSNNIKKKMKIISDKYKNMKGKKPLSLKNLKSKFRALFKTMKTNLKLKGVKNGGKKTKAARSNKRTSRRKRTHRQRGGYHQYMGNVGGTPGYSVAGTTLGSQNLNEANPPPITRYMNGGDNYNHYTGKSVEIWN